MGLAAHPARSSSLESPACASSARARRAHPFLFALLCAALLGWPPSAAFGQGLFGAGEEEESGEEANEKAPFDITADTVEFDTARQVYVARGNVRLEQPRRILTSDWMVFSDKTREGVASGNVVVTEGSDKLFADVLHFEVDEMAGIVFDGKLETGNSNFIATGDTIKRVGEQEYVFEDAVFTTCRCPEGETEPWTIEANEANLEFGGYAVTKSTTFNILGLPVLWSPRAYFPLKTERETGFLFPTFNAASRNGFDVGVPFFWAAADNVNVLLTPRYLSKNGFKPEGKIDYVFGPITFGELYGTWIRDDETNPNDLSTPFSQDRWAVQWRHDQALPFDWRWKVDAHFLSDNNYTFDFRDVSRVRDDRYVEAKTFVENRFGPIGRYGFTGAIHYAEDQQNPDNQDRDKFLLQRMPDLKLSGLPQPLPGPLDKAVWSFDTRYTHFWARDDVQDRLPNANIVDGLFADTGIDAIPNGDERDSRGRLLLPDGSVELRDGTITTAADILATAQLDPLFDPLADPLLIPTADGNLDDAPGGQENDGQFQEGEPLADRGHRVVLNPRVAFPFRVADTIEVLPEFGWHGTFYNTDNKSTDFRNLFTAMIDVRSRLRREIQIPSWLREGQRAVHLVEPRVTYTAVEGAGQSGNPLFIPRPQVQNQRLRQLEPTSFTRDPSDRIDDVQALTFAVGNRIYIPGLEIEDEIGPPRLFADFTVSLHHDFADSDLTSLYLDGVAVPWQGVRTRFNLGFDLDDPELREALFSISWGSLEGHDLSLSYRLVRDVPRFFENFSFDTERFDDFNQGFLQINQLDLYGRFAVTRNWAFTYRLRYSFEETLALGNAFGMEYLSSCYCWAIRAELADRRNRGFEFNFRYRILGLGDDHVRPFSRRKRGETDPLLQDTDLDRTL